MSLVTINLIRNLVKKITVSWKEIRKEEVSIQKISSLNSYLHIG